MRVSWFKSKGQRKPVYIFIGIDGSSYITATARKLAVIIWNMITKVQPCKIREPQLNSQKTKATILRNIEKRIEALQLNQEELNKLFLKTSFLTE